MVYVLLILTHPGHHLEMLPERMVAGLNFSRKLRQIANVHCLKLQLPKNVNIYIVSLKVSMDLFYDKLTFIVIGRDNTSLRYNRNK